MAVERNSARDHLMTCGHPIPKSTCKDTKTGLTLMPGVRIHARFSEELMYFWRSFLMCLFDFIVIF